MEIKWERWSDTKPTENGWYMTFNENTEKFDMSEWGPFGWSGEHSEISHWIKVELPEKPPKYSIASFPKSKDDNHLYWVEEYYDKVG